jgi:O-antigen ligase
MSTIGIKDVVQTSNVVPSLALAIYILNIFRPYPSFLDGIAKVFWFDIIILAILGFMLFYAKLRLRSLLVSIFMICILLITSLNKVGLDQLTQLLRVIYFILFTIILVAPWARSDQNYFFTLSWFLVVSIFPMSVIYFFQLFHVDGFSSIVHLLYGTDKLRFFYSLSPRVYGSFHNANWAGVYVMVCWLAMYFLLSNRILSVRAGSFIAILLLVMTVATGSRTALVGIIVSLSWMILATLMFSQVSKGGRGVIVIGCIVLVGIFIISTVDIETQMPRRLAEVLTAQSVTEVSSLDARFVSWEKGINHFLKSPILGPGVIGIPHNSYIAWLQAFGLVGTSVFFLFMLAIVARYLFIGPKQEIIFSSSVLVGFMVVATVAEFFFTTQVVLLVIPIIAGVLFVSKQKT